LYRPHKFGGSATGRGDDDGADMMMRAAGLFISVLALAFGAGSARAQFDVTCSWAEKPPKTPVPDAFLVFFDWDSAAITQQAALILDNLVNVLTEVPAACPLDMIGHTDRSGPANYNMALSRRRAEAVMAYLRRHGVQRKNTVRAFGEKTSLVDTPDGVREPQNRFVEIYIGYNP
jgi:outer membrane protein OmpA-like peptidoglycan-associated protein